MKENANENTIKVKYDESGLVPVVVQDYVSGEVLMLAYADERALRLTLESSELYLFSRSRASFGTRGKPAATR